jgi:hypothetical protein
VRDQLISKESSSVEPRAEIRTTTPIYTLHFL